MEEKHILYEDLDIKSDGFEPENIICKNKATIRVADIANNFMDDEASLEITVRNNGSIDITELTSYDHWLTIPPEFLGFFEEALKKAKEAKVVDSVKTCVVCGGLGFLEQDEDMNCDICGGAGQVNK